MKSFNIDFQWVVSILVSVGTKNLNQQGPY